MIPEEKMKMTINIAREALGKGELPIAAIIFYGNEIIASSHTSEKEDKRLLIHAELKALLEADKMNFSLKERKEMQLFTNLEPCMMCLGAAISFLIGEINYALEAPVDGAVKIAQAHWKWQNQNGVYYQLPKITNGIMRSESKSLFHEFLTISEPGPLYDFAKSLAERADMD